MNKFKVSALLLCVILYPALEVFSVFPNIILKLLAYVFSVGSALYFLISHFSKVIKKFNNKIASLESEKTAFNCEMQVAASQIAAVSEDLFVNIDDNNKLAQSLYKDTEEMDEQNQKVNNSINLTMEEVRNIISLLEQSNISISDMEATGKSSFISIDNNRKSILNISDTIKDIHESSNETLKCVNSLNHRSEEIATILDTVNAILKQTQLVSLNASIEAARAGEAGKSFTVVSSEIGKLALNIGTAVDEINDKINHIQEESINAAEAVRENYVKVENAVKLSNSLEEDLSQIEDSFNKVLSITDKVSGLFKQEIQMTRKIGDQIINVENAIKNADASVAEVKNSVNRQKENTSQIHTLGQKLNMTSDELASIFTNSNLVTPNVEVTFHSEGRMKELLLLADELLKSDSFIACDKEHHNKALSQLLNSRDYIKAIWTNDHKGRFICSIPEAGIANAAARDWFKHSISGENFISQIYISAINKKPCVTLSVPLRDRDGKIFGVLGIDSDPV